MLRCGLLGRTLGHSWSPAIHRQLGDYAYALYEKTEAELGPFLESGAFDGLNVTIPYKKAVLPWCRELSDTARAIGSVNTLLRRPDGSLYGDNTDGPGFVYMARRSGVPVRGEKVLVLGSGGASLAVRWGLAQLGAAEVVTVSRSGPVSYGGLDRHRDAGLIVNTTPLGMYPQNGAAALSPADFPRCRGVLDVIYNPRRTALLLEAEALGLACGDGLPMLVAQARRSAELFTGASIPPERVEQILGAMGREQENIILIGMPGSGKTSVGRALAAALGRPFRDADAVLEEKAGRTIPDLFAGEGEPAFRARETETLRELGRLSGQVIATGGGCVLREENYGLLHQNGTILWLRRDAARLERQGRPLSLEADLAEMERRREPRYARFADREIDNNGPLADTVRAIREALA